MKNDVVASVLITLSAALLLAFGLLPGWSWFIPLLSHLHVLLCSVFMFVVCFPLGSLVLQIAVPRGCRRDVFEPSERLLISIALGVAILSTMAFFLAALNLYSSQAVIILFTLLALGGLSFWTRVIRGMPTLMPEHANDCAFRYPILF